MRRYSLFFLIRTLIATLVLAFRAAWLILRSRETQKPDPRRKHDKRSRPSGPRPLVLYSQVAWDDVWQRPQEMAVGLSRYRPVLFLAPVQIHDCLGRYRGKWKALRRGPGDTTLWIAAPRIFPGEYKSPRIRSINRRLIVAETRRLVQKLYPDYPTTLFLTNSPFSDFLLDALLPSAIVYDVIDDFIAFDWAPPDGPDREQHLFRMADLVFTGTDTLLRKKSPSHPECHFIACGVDFDRFASGKDQPEPPDLKNLPRPILGYMGTLSDRLDRDLIQGLARRFPQASIVFIGPIHGSFGPPIEAPNLHYLGLRPPEALAPYVARFDVALMLFAQTEAARAINPVKTLEYLAAGCPVVSTPIPDVERFYGEVVITAPAVDPFLDAVDHCLKTPQTDRIQRGIEMARSRSWGGMVEEMEMHIARLDTTSPSKSKE